ncbi:MAG: sugar porter family MFS transporter [Cyclobacteriaceae bacterium]|jgi:sugar porter (SP) family MFS transporter|nr:sugar porter family MFS transporter [Cyclobacteriaceae bacterium]
MKNNLTFIALVAAMAGFLFGFDTVVISGANLPIKNLWNTSPWFHGFFIMSMALWGTVIGALFGGKPTEKYGRKKVLFWIGILYTLSAVGSALAPEPYSFSFFRFIGGVGVGISSIAAPTYIAEIASSATRGRLVAMYQFNIVFGILIAFISNYLLQGFGGANDWRWMLGVEALPAIAYTLMVIGIPESPRWLITNRNDVAGATQVLRQVGTPDPEQEISQIVKANEEVEALNNREQFFSRKYSKPIILAFLIAFFNQFSGINFILYYAPEILERAGLAAKDSLFNSIAIGGVNLIFTFVGLYFIDRTGRRNLMLIGSFGYIISLTMVAYSFYAGAGPGLMMTFLLIFIASHAFGQGTVIWVFISEIFPNKVRAMGQSFGASIHWVCAALITLITPVFLDSANGVLKDDPWIIFVFFAGIMTVQLLWVLTTYPETKGVSLEEIQHKLGIS